MGIDSRTYLDYAATTPLDPRVLDAMMPYLSQPVANPNALYREGRDAYNALEGARHEIASLAGAHDPSEIVFTSGGSESDAAAIFGIVEGLEASQPGKAPKRIITTMFEHHAILEDVHRLERKGYEVVLLKPDKRGYITPEALSKALSGGACLVSIMAANNEVGTIQPIAQLAGIAHEAGALFHTDAMQSMGKIGISLEESGIDAATFGAHKMGGPLGAGALYLRRTTPYLAQVLGGGQESGRRSGTQNVAGAVGFAKAFELAAEGCDSEAVRESAMRDQLADALEGISPRVHVIADPRKSGWAWDGTGHLPGLLCICVEGVESETMVLRLDEEGFMVSGGSACSSGSLDPSSVLLSMGVPYDLALGELRITMGAATTPEQAGRLADIFPKVIR